MKATLLATVALATIAATRAVAADSPVAGGPGGQDAFRLICPGSSSLVGLAGLSDDVQRISELSMRCANIDENGFPGTVSTGPRVQAKIDPPPTSPLTVADCIGNNQKGVIDAFDGHTDRILAVGAEVVTHIAPRCRRVTPSGPISTSYGTFFEIGEPFNGKPAGTRFAQRSCPKGEVARGIFGRFGSHLDAFGLVCGPLLLSPAAPGEASYDAPISRAPADRSKVLVGDRFEWSSVEGAKSYRIVFSGDNESGRPYGPGEMYERVVKTPFFVVDAEAIRRLHDIEPFWGAVACKDNGERCSRFAGGGSQRRAKFDSLPVANFITAQDTLVGPGDTVRWSAVAAAERYRWCTRSSAPPTSSNFPKICGGGPTDPGGEVVNEPSVEIDANLMLRHVGETFFLLVSPCSANARRCGVTDRPGAALRLHMRDFDAGSPVEPVNGARARIQDVRFHWSPDTHATSYRFCLRDSINQRSPCQLTRVEDGFSQQHDPSRQFDLRPFEGRAMYWTISACTSRFTNTLRCGPESAPRRIDFAAGRDAITVPNQPKTDPAPELPVPKT